MNTGPKSRGVWIVLAVALSARVAWVCYRWTTRGAAFEYPDEALHWDLATNLAHGRGLVSADGRYAARMPLYPLVLALWAPLGSAGILAARLAQAAIGAATAILAYRTAGHLGGPVAGMAVGLLVAIDPFGVFFANLLLTEVLFTFVLVALFAAALWWLEERRESAVSTLLVALLGAAAVLTRPAAILLLPLNWAVLARSALGCPARIALLALCPLMLLVALVPWGLRNKAVLGDYAILSANGGVTLYDAQGPQADGSSDQTFLQQLPELRGLSEVERDRLLRRLAMQQMRREPARVLVLATTKFLRTWSPFPNVAEYRGGPAAAAGAAYTIVVLVVAVGGLWYTWRSPPRRTEPSKVGLRYLQLLVWIGVAYFTLVHMVYIGSVRYRVPLMPLLALASVAVFVQRAENGERRRPGGEEEPRLSGPHPVPMDDPRCGADNPQSQDGRPA